MNTRHLLSSIAIALLFLSIAMTPTDLSWYVNAQEEEFQEEPEEIPFQPLEAVANDTSATPEDNQTSAPPEDNQTSAPPEDTSGVATLTAPTDDGATTPLECEPPEVLNEDGTECVEPEDGATEDGATEDGATEDGATEDGATEDGATEDGATEDGATPLECEPPEVLNEDGTECVEPDDDGNQGDDD